MRTIAGAIVAAVAWLTLGCMWRHCTCPLTARSLHSLTASIGTQYLRRPATH
jgi:hypothetical protein